VRRIEKRGISMSDMGVALGLHYVAKHKYKLAAKAFNRSPSTMTAQGVWLIYDSVEDLTGVFKNEEAATTVFAHDHYDWFDHYYEKSNMPAVKDVIPFLDQTAIDHIRKVMANRRVWFPDGGPDERGEYVVLTPKVLAEYDDATILDWLANPSDEDESEGVFDDIIEAIQLAGVDILQGASQDNVYTGYIKAAVDAIDGKEHKWTNHPTKKYQTGEPMEAFKVFVPWKVVFDWAEKYRDEHGYNYDGDLESLAVNVNAETADPDINNMEAGWHDVNKEWARKTCIGFTNWTCLTRSPEHLRTKTQTSFRCRSKSRLTSTARKLCPARWTVFRLISSGRSRRSSTTRMITGWGQSKSR